MPKNSEKYVRRYILTEDDYKQIGCTQAEINSAKECFQKVKEANDKLDALGDGALPDEKLLNEKSLAIENMYSIFLKAADKHPEKWEYKASQLPDWLLSTGNSSLINQFLRTNGDQLTIADKAKLLKRRMLTLKASVNLSKAEQAAEGLVDQALQINEEHEAEGEEITASGDGVEEAFLEGVHQKAFQKSGNGCWSVSTTMLLQSRGINNVNQFDVRSYRPPYEKKDIIDKLKPESKVDKDGNVRTISFDEEEYFEMLENDKSSSVMERGDAFLNFAPGSMLQGLEIAGYNDDVRRLGISREEYLKRTEDTVKKHIIHAIKEEKSPVSFLRGGHYLTIVGITKDNKVLYKDSYPRYKDEQRKELYDVDHTFEIPLRDLVKRVAYEKSSMIKMEWAADIKLSKDGKRLYDIPTDLLTIGENGEVQNPVDNAYLDNLSIGYQCKDGMYIKTRNSSDSPDISKNIDDNLLAGGVNMTQTIYLPKTLNMKILKSKAQARSFEEEERLKEDTKNFYKVEHGKNPKYQTQDEVNAKYNSLNGDMVRANEAKGQALVAGIKDRMAQALAGPIPADQGGSRDYDKYIRTLCVPNKLARMDNDQLRDTFAQALAAIKMKKEGEKFDEKRLKTVAGRIKSDSRLNDMTYGQCGDLRTVLSQPSPVEAVRKVEELFVNDIYMVEPQCQKAYIAEMKQLADNMLTKEKRSTLYQNLYDAVHEAAMLNPDDPDISNKIAEVNRKVIECDKKYMSGKETVRFHKDGQDRFNNALDALSIVGAYAPKAYILDVTPAVANINRKRGATNAKDPDRVDIRLYGGSRARRRNEEIIKENALKNQEKNKSAMKH